MESIQDHIYNKSPVWLQNVLVSAYGYNLYRKRYTGVFHEIRDLLNQSRSWSTSQIEAWQAEQLHNMIRHCRETVPYYQRLFADYKLHENDFTTVQDVRKLPILTKATLKQNIDSFRSTESKTYVVQHTSGSTGTPLALDVDEYTYKLAMALVIDHEESHGVLFGARRATFAGRMIQPAEKLSPPFARFNKAENQMLFSSYHLNEKTFPFYAEKLNNFKPEELIGYPSAIADLASHYQITNINPSFQPTAIVTNSETLLEWQREKIEKTFKCPVYDYYGSAEYVVFAGQQADKTYRLNPIIGLTELIEENGLAASEGRIIATTLNNKAMPLLRYETGDTGRSANSSAGRDIARTLTEIGGRTDDYIELPDGRKLGRLDHIFKDVDGLIEGQIVQKSTNEVIVKVVFNGPPSDATVRGLAKNLKTRAGDQISIEIQPVERIPRGPNGKFRNVIKTEEAGNLK